MSKTTSCEHGTDTFEFTCTWCLEDENESLRAEVETLKAERDALLQQQIMDTECIERIRSAGERDAARVEELEKAIITAVDALDTVAPGRIEREADHQTHLLSALINRRT